jgi:hypothetical protein
LCKEPQRLSEPSAILATTAASSSPAVFFINHFSNVAFQIDLPIFLTIPEAANDFVFGRMRSQRVRTPRKDDGSKMGSLRKMPRETPIVEPIKVRLAGPPDLELVMQSLDAFAKDSYQHAIMAELQNGCTTLPRQLRNWSWGSHKDRHIFYGESHCNKWLEDLIESGRVVERNGVYWRSDKVPPNDEALKLYGLIPEKRSAAVSAARLAQQMGVSVETVEVMLKDIKSGFGRNIRTTLHQPPRYCKWL